MKLIRSILVPLLFVAAVSQIVSAQTDSREYYNLTIGSEMTMTIQGQKQLIEAGTMLNYHHQREKEKMTVGLNAIEVTASQAGTVIIDLFQNEEVMRLNDDTTEFKDADAALKTSLEDSFKSPLCEFDIDENGQLSKPNDISKRGAKPLIDNGQIENIVFLHPVFFDDKQEWEAPVKFSCGNGNFATGDLTYKVKSKKADKVTVEVNGKLLASGKQMGLEIVDGVYLVSGTQVFDMKSKRWTSADIELDVSFDLNMNDKKVADANGVMNLVMKPIKASMAKGSPNKKTQPEGSDKKGADEKGRIEKEQMKKSVDEKGASQKKGG